MGYNKCIGGYGYYNSALLFFMQSTILSKFLLIFFKFLGIFLGNLEMFRFVNITVYTAIPNSPLPANSASNSSLVIFSFSNSSAALLCRMSMCSTMIAFALA